MTERISGWMAWCGVSLAAASLLLVVVNIVLAAVNGRTQAEVAARQQFIADGPQYNEIGEALVHSLSVAASATNDQALIAMMQRHGLSPSGAAPASARRTR